MDKLMRDARMLEHPRTSDHLTLLGGQSGWGGYMHSAGLWQACWRSGTLLVAL